MDDKETLNRRARLRELIRECFNDKPIELRRHIQARTGVEPNQGELAAIMKPNSGKSFADRKAKKLTEQIGLYRRWFDMPLGTDIDRSKWMSASILPPLHKSIFGAESDIDNNVEVGPEIRGEVPLISWVQAGDWVGVVDNYAPGVGEELIPTTIPVKRHTYALRVKGDSMTNPNGWPSFPEGMIIIVEPEFDHEPGDFVIVKNGDNEATFKQLVKDGTDWLLKPLNPRYPIKLMPADATICGVVRGYGGIIR